MITQTTKGSAVVTLPTDTSILITREFNAPKHLVFKAWTTPEYVERWWPGNHGSMTVTDIDLRVGGAWRWVMMTPENFEVAFRGEYHEIVPNEKLVYTEIFEPFPHAGAVCTLTFTEKDGRTLLTMHVEHKEKEHRDAHINSGMEGGMQVSMDLLETVAISLA